MSPRPRPDPPRTLPGGGFPGRGDRPNRLRPAVQYTDAQIRDLREALAASPEDPRMLHGLGMALETRAEQEKLLAGRDALTGRVFGREYLEEAAKLYLAGAHVPGPRYRQAAFYAAAAAVASKLQQPEAEYRALQQALRLAPYSPTLWRDLQECALQTGRTEENRRARRMALEWTFPGLRAR